MKRILSLICVLVLVASQCQAGWWITLGEEAGGGDTFYVGKFDAAGAPDLDGSCTQYGSAGDRIYGPSFTASENGTITGVNVYVSQTWANANYVYLCAYKGDIYMGKSADQKGQTSGSQWSGWVALVEESPGDLDFVTNDVITFGVCADGGEINRYAADSGDSTTPFNYDSGAWSEDPTPDVTGWSVSTTKGFCAGLRYVN